MPTLAKGSAGTILSISASLPASEVLASYSALTYTPIGEVTDIGEYGKKFNKTEHNPIGDRGTYKIKTSYDNGALSLQMAKAISDAGQILLLAARDSDADYTMKVTYPNSGGNDYFRVKVFGYVTNIGSVTTILGAKVEVELVGDVFSD